VSETLYITLLLVELYIAIGVMLIGFGYMIAGKIGGGRVASFYFGRSLRWVRDRVRLVLAWTLTRVGTIALFWIARPLAYRLWLGLRWLAGTRRRMAMALALVVLCALTLVAFAAGSAAAQTVTVQAQGRNMFYVDVVLNNRVKVRALVDTGATFLSVPGCAAAALGLVLGEHVRLRTANGIVTNRMTIVQSVRIGAIEVRNVAGTVDEREKCDERMLVGMTVLSKLHVTLENDRLILVARSGTAARAGPIELWVLGAGWAVLLFSLLIVRQPYRGLARSRKSCRDPMATAPLASRSFFE
jgi:clan AA aspartic protease (TIGR02281 family)